VDRGRQDRRAGGAGHGAGERRRHDRRQGPVRHPRRHRRHTHLDMPFGGTTSIDDFDTGTVAAAHGGTTIDRRLRDPAVQGRDDAGRARHLARQGRGQGGDRLRLPHDRDRPPAGAARRDGGIVKRGRHRASSSSWPTRACSSSTISRSSAPCCGPASSARSSACTPRRACPIDVLVERALAEGQPAPIYHALTRPEAAEATGTERAIALAEMAERAGLHRPPVGAARARARDGGPRSRPPAYAETCPQYLFLSEDDLRGTPDDRVRGRRSTCARRRCARSTTTITCGAA
jgi:dihydropyrimidinase